MTVQINYAKYRNEFKKNGFVKIKNILSPEIVELYKAFIDLSYIREQRCDESSPYLAGPIHAITDNTINDCILLYCKHIAEEFFEVEDLIPSYAYSREYFQGSELKVHRDRGACQYSLTLTISKRGSGTSVLWFSEEEDKSNAVAVDLDEGDAIIFNGGSEYGGKWHWRDPLELDSMVQIFLHYLHPDNAHLADNSYPRPNYRSR